MFSRFFQFSISSLFLIFFFSWSWIVSLTFFFCFLLFTKTTIVFFFSQKTRFCLFPFLLDMFHNYFSCFVLFFCLEKWFLVFVLTLLFFFFFFLPFNIQFHIYYFPVLMYLKNVVFSNKLEKTSSVFSLSSIFLFFFFCSLVFFLNKCVWLILLFSNSFWNSLLILFLSSLFSHEKNQPRNLHFCFCSVPFLFHFFFFQHFSFFFYHHFFFDHFSFDPFVHTFLLFYPFSLLSFLHSSFISLSQCFSFSFFLYLMFTHLFSPSPLLRILFLFQLIFLLSLSYDLDVFVFLLLLKFVSSSPSLFAFLKKSSKFSVVNFLKTRLCLCFSNPPVIRVKSRVFFLLASSFSLVCSSFLLLRFFIVTFLDHRYFSWFSFINLLFGPLKNRFEVRTYHSSFNVFFFFWKILYLFVSVHPKKKTSKKMIDSLCFFSWLLPRFVLSLCVLSLCLLSLLLLL